MPGEIRGRTTRIPMVTRFGPYQLDAQRRQLSRDGQVLHLTPKAYDLLLLLVDAAPRVVPKSEIHEALWPSGVVTDATLAGLIKELRRVLSEPSDGAPIIRTAHRVGYALDVPVIRDFEPQGESHWLIAMDRRIALARGANVIGRDPAASVWLDYSTISRRHARVTVLPTGTTLEDLGSKNGTSMRGVPVTRTVPLQNGDEFACGQLVITYLRSSTELPTATEISRVVEPGTRR
jgi:DNA-binding winged helix-turn-helix (wHTH) protein